MPNRHRIQRPRKDKGVELAAEGFGKTCQTICVELELSATVAPKQAVMPEKTRISHSLQDEARPEDIRGGMIQTAACLVNEEVGEGTGRMSGRDTGDNQGRCQGKCRKGRRRCGEGVGETVGEGVDGNHGERVGAGVEEEIEERTGERVLKGVRSSV